MKILTYTTLFPNVEMPHHGIFVAERLRHLLASGDVSAKVLAPIPWFPSVNERFGRYASYARTPDIEFLEQTEVLHPRYPVIPKVGMTVAPLLLALACRRVIRDQLDGLADFDLIDAHYFFPDGVAAVLLGKWFRKPVVITGRGTDLNLIPGYHAPRHMIKWAAERASGIITVSESLKSCLVDYDVPASKIRTLRNGVDLELFRPLRDRNSVRRKFNVEGICLLSVGHLIERKGHHYIIQALSFLPDDVGLVIAGEGPWREKLRSLARSTGVENRVRFLGSRSHAELVEHYNAADALVLASSREGMPNVILESLACGTPVVATSVWGNPEIVAQEVAGELVSNQEPEAIARAVQDLLARNEPRVNVRKYAEQFSWSATTAGQLDVFKSALQSVVP